MCVCVCINSHRVSSFAPSLNSRPKWISPFITINVVFNLKIYIYIFETHVPSIFSVDIVKIFLQWIWIWQKFYLNFKFYYLKWLFCYNSLDTYKKKNCTWGVTFYLAVTTIEFFPTHLFASHLNPVNNCLICQAIVFSRSVSDLKQTLRIFVKHFWKKTVI